MVWERLVPVVAPFLVLGLVLAVAGQWGVFKRILPVWHAGLIITGVIVAFIAAIRASMRFKMPDFGALYRRVASDNDMTYEQILNLRHQPNQPRMRLGRPKAGIAQDDPFALRFVAVLMAALGYLIFGPVPVSQWVEAFTPNLSQLKMPQTASVKS